MPDKPEEYAWKGAKRYVTNMKNEYGKSWRQKIMVTRQEYLEYGNEYTNKKLRSGI
jgi:actin-related protein